MIKVIKEGNANRIPIYQKECDDCGCIFEFTSSDYNRTYDECVDEDYTHIKCPCCKKRLYLTLKAIRYE